MNTIQRLLVERDSSTDHIRGIFHDGQPSTGISINFNAQDVQSIIQNGYIYVDSIQYP